MEWHQPDSLPTVNLLKNLAFFNIISTRDLRNSRKGKSCLGKPLKAFPYLELAEKSLDKAESVTPRWHSLLEISRGQTFYNVGDITTAIDVISKGFIVAYQCHSPHQMNRVRKLLRKLEGSSFQNHPRVQDLKNLLYETYLRMDNEAGDDASRVQWHAVENLQALPYLAFNHIRLLRMALRQFFTTYYHDAVGIQAIDACQCELAGSSGLHYSNTAYWRYNGIALCPRDMLLLAKKASYR